MRRTSLPILDPCPADWNAMTGDERRRHCTACALDVVNLSALTERAARALIDDRRGERLCVRYEHDVRGDVVFERPAPERRLPIAALVTVLAACTANPGDPALSSEPDPFADECTFVDGEEAGQCEQDDPALERVVIDLVVPAPERVHTAVSTVGGFTVGILATTPTGHAELVMPDAAPVVQATRAPEQGLPLTTWLGPIEPLAAPTEPQYVDALEPAARATAILRRTLR